MDPRYFFFRYRVRKNSGMTKTTRTQESSRNMKTINLSQNFNKAVETAADALLNNKIIIYPTDTLYGLGGNALDKKTIEKVFEIKKRDRKKPLPIIVKDLKMARRAACIDSKAEKILEKIWNADSINKIGPVTVVLRKKDIIPYSLTAGGETVALRPAGNLFLNALFQKIDFPLIATSANFSGQPAMSKINEIIEEFKTSDCLIIDNGDLENTTPSVIIDLSNINYPKILRSGEGSKEKLFEVFEILG